ncbi:MAG: hypothetical protein NT018_09220 [Armatimonadetes bacterium]|nr:hypothetical protein [Armatimonadota bacterium]
MVAKTDPSRIIMIKGARPLEMMYSERYGVVLYASNMDYIKYAVGGEFGWIEARIPRDALVVINTSSMTITEIVPVRWQRSTTLC